MVSKFKTSFSSKSMSIIFLTLILKASPTLELKLNILRVLVCILYCLGMAWPIVDNLLFHYASHHNVLEKVVMYESEVAATNLREVIKGKENTIEDLVKEIGDMKNSESGKTNGAEGSNVEMRGIVEQMIKEMDGLKQKIISKNTTIKSLKDELGEARRSFKSCEERYEEVVKYNLSIQNELKSMQKNVGAGVVKGDVPVTESHESSATATADRKSQ